jgi:hypothetical protein
MTKVFYGNQYIGKITVDGKRYTKWQLFKYRFWLYTKRAFKVAMAIVCLSWFGYGAYLTGGMNNPKTVFAEKDVPVIDNTLPPVLQRIEKCESSNMQKNSQGQTLIHVNTNGTYDQGEFEINSTWNAQATKLGYDLSTADGNEAMARWLYANIGTSPWYSSQNCWQK